jgi:hypothetical protein
MIWWIVGTAVYQVALYARMSDQNVDAENLPADGSVTAAPTERELSKPAIKAWTWKKGRTITVESDSVSLYTETMFRTEEARLSYVSGTPLRLVVPDVWRKSATSDGSLTIPATNIDSAVTSDVEERESSDSPSELGSCRFGRFVPFLGRYLKLGS